MESAIEAVRIALKYRTPVILLTARSEAESRHEGLRAGADDYLAKPFNAEDLWLRIRNLIEQRRKLVERYEEKLATLSVDAHGRSGVGEQHLLEGIAERVLGLCGRADLAAIEQDEIAVLESYLPAKMDDTELDALIDEVIAATGAESIRDMGKVMGAIKAKAAGRADMGAVGSRVKARLGA